MRSGRSAPRSADRLRPPRPAVREEGDAVHLRPDDAIVEEIRRLIGSSAVVLEDPELMRAALPSLRADYRAVETYRAAPEDVVGCPISVLTGDDDPQVTVEEAGEWREHTTGSFDKEVFPGGHFYLVDEMERIVALLDRHMRPPRPTPPTCGLSCHKSTASERAAPGPYREQPKASCVAPGSEGGQLGTWRRLSRLVAISRSSPPRRRCDSAPAPQNPHPAQPRIRTEAL
ncbi:thioesterase domain-containing protein [Streptomyces sp. DG2A-72]|uniref:thioesterase II family protein n=1 Tax=Streptomyces sp. DG2A-72 TaxID=3051386 RepID=UPI00265BA060|nr:thioesterase domain-containing protein [Streptomyces sp. DG2A-72]MDO0930225.1 thioesterase domain-containing protein [Streptomyces sp. DG2A-72]